MRNDIGKLAILVMTAAFGLVGCTWLIDYPPEPSCGDGEATGPEQCDGADLRGATCSSLGQGTGSLVCSTACRFDTTGCTSSTCGNGTVEQAAGEECDGSNHDNRSCPTEGFTDGDLACTSSCKLDVSGCNNVGETCGNGSLDTGENCDDGNNQDCDGCHGDCSREDNVCGDGIQECSEQCDDGNLTNGDGCNQDCQEEVQPGCGNGVVDAGEQCDGSALGGQACEDFGCFTGGTLICTGTCELDFSQCQGAPTYFCGNGTCDPGETTTSCPQDCTGCAQPATLLDQSSREGYYWMDCTGGMGFDIETQTEVWACDASADFRFDCETNGLESLSDWRFGYVDCASVWGDTPDFETLDGFYNLSWCSLYQCDTSLSQYQTAVGEVRYLHNSNSPWGSYMICMKNVVTQQIAIFRYAKQDDCRFNFWLALDNDNDGSFCSYPAPACDDGEDNDGDGHTDHPDDLQCSSPLDDDESG